MQSKADQTISLIELLAKIAPDSSKSKLRSWIEQGRVMVQGEVAKTPQQVVQASHLVTVGSRCEFLPKGLKIVYEDTALVVVDKPAGLLSVATERERALTVHAFLKRRFNRAWVYPIHRLDCDTSGLMVFAYTTRARDSLKEQLAARAMHREYRALVHGHPGNGVWRCFLRENRQMTVFVCSSSLGKEAITHFETLERRQRHSLLKLTLETGRKHQIRVQAAHAGFPIVGDSKYGTVRDRGRAFHLRAVALYFSHPYTGKEMRFTHNPTCYLPS